MGKGCLQHDSAQHRFPYVHERTVNAIKFTESGHVYIRVSLEKRGDNSSIPFDVEDTGIGIASDKQQVIFGSFLITCGPPKSKGKRLKKEVVQAKEKQQIGSYNVWRIWHGESRSDL